MVAFLARFSARRRRGRFASGYRGTAAPRLRRGLRVFQRYDTTAGRGSACPILSVAGRRRAAARRWRGVAQPAGHVQRRRL